MRYYSYLISLLWLVLMLPFGMIGVTIWHTFNYNRDYSIPAGEVSASENERTRLLGAGA